jgi:hypothetical protein
VQPAIWLANKDDIASFTYDVTYSTLVTAITMNSGGAFYKFQGFRQSVTPSTEFVPADVAIGYNHILEFHVFDISAAQKENLQKMALDKMVAIVENANVAGNSNSVFEIFGGGVGMEVLTLTRLSRDADTMGAFAITLQTPDNQGKESKLPLSFWDTDYATTKAKVVALETPAP